MAQPVTIKGGKVRVLLDLLGSGTYTTPCGFTNRSVTFNKALNEFSIPDCLDPDAIDWLGRDAVSLSMAVSGEGVLASESVESWLDAFYSVDSIPAKVEIEFPAKTITFTGAMHVESMDVGANNGQRATANISMQSDGIMTKVVV